MVQVRLEIMTSQPADLNTGGGDIETYLENFCRWIYLEIQVGSYHVPVLNN